MQSQKDGHKVHNLILIDFIHNKLTYRENLRIFTQKVVCLILVKSLCKLIVHLNARQSETKDEYRATDKQTNKQTLPKP